MITEKRVLIALLAAVSAFGAETAAERGRRIVDEALQALGGDAFLRVQDRTETGRAYSFNRAELSALAVARIYTRYAAPDPNKKIALRERQAYFPRANSKVEDEALLFTDEGGWALTYRGAVPFSDERYANFVDSTRRNIFYFLRQRRNEPGIDYYYMGSAVFENRPVYTVEITDSANDKLTVYFSQNDKLPVRQSFKRRSPQFKDYDTEVSIFDKYRDIGGGVKWPFNIRRERNGEKIFEMFSDSVEINKGLTDDLLTIPGSMKILPKSK